MRWKLLTLTKHEKWYGFKLYEVHTKHTLKSTLTTTPPYDWKQLVLNAVSCQFIIHTYIHVRC